MTLKNRSATYRLNIALEGAVSCVSVMRQNGLNSKQRDDLLVQATIYLDEANAALLDIKAHRDQI